MFDLGFAELLFVAALALVVVGPKDLPKLLKTFGQIVNRGRKLYADTMSGIKQLEREVDIASTDPDSANRWADFLPEDIRRLPDDFAPGKHSADTLKAHKHAYRSAVMQAKSEHAAHTAKPETTDE